jgi:transcriptional regulator NrdR family protein
MICLSASAIMILMEDGSKKQFDPEELQNKLTTSCRSVGIKDFWLAEDMTNAVENALHYQSERGVIFTENEINLFVEKMLEQAGYKEVSVKFRLLGKTGDEEKLFSREAISKFLKTNLNFNDGESLATAKKVLRACSSLGIRNPPSSLILEFARYYKTTTSETQKITPPERACAQLSTLILQRKEILPLLSDKTNELIDYGIIDISGVSTLFPSIKIDLKFEALSRFCGLEGLLTEMAFFPCFDITAAAINEIIPIVKKKLISHKEIQQETPVFLRFSDMYLFCKKFFGVEFPEGESFCKELASAFTETLKHPVQIKGLKVI